MSEWASQWGRMLAAPAEVAEANLKLFEALVSAPFVVAARTPKLETANGNSPGFDKSELNRTAVEKRAASNKKASVPGSDLLLRDGARSLQQMWSPLDAMADWMRFWDGAFRMPSQTFAPVRRTVRVNRRGLPRG